MGVALCLILIRATRYARFKEVHGRVNDCGMVTWNKPTTDGLDSVIKRPYVARLQKTVLPMARP